MEVTLRVADLERARSFYAGVLGFVADQDFPGEKLRFRVDPEAALVLLPLRPGTVAEDRFGERRAGLDHLTFTVAGRPELERLAGALKRAGVRTGGVREPGFLAFHDPDGVAWECYAQPISLA